MKPVTVVVLDTEPSSQNRYITLSIVEALRRDPRVASVVSATHRDAVATMAGGSVDLFLAFGGARPHTPLLSRLAALAGRSVLWTSEDPYEIAGNVRLSSAFDLVFTNDRSSLAAYGGRARHLPLAASRLFQDLPARNEDHLYRYDLLFIGTAWPNRVATLNHILATLPPTARVKLALPSNAFLPLPKLVRPDLITDWRCGNRDFARLANASRIVLTLPRAFTADETARASGTTPPPRLFETALAGAYQLVVGADPEVRDYYDEGREIGLCSEPEAAAAIADALARPGRRIAVAAAARARTLREHLYEHRVAALLDRILAVRPPAVARPRRTERKRILCVSHNRAGYRAGGGVEVYQERLLGLSAEFEFLFLFPVRTGTPFNWRLQGEGIDREIVVNADGRPALTDPRIEGEFQRILFEERIDLVHLNHLLHWPLSLPLVAGACGVPVVYHLHDHYLICERWRLLDDQGRFCDVVRRGRHRCDACLIAADDYPVGSKARREAFVALVCRAVDAFVANTAGTASYLRAFYPDIPSAKIAVIEMLDATPAPPAPPPTRPTGHDPAPPGGAAGRDLLVAVPNGLSAHKGGDDLIALMRLCEGRGIRFKVFGPVEPHYAGRLKGLPAGLVDVIGPYEQEAIVGMMRGCDVALHLSTWPETYVLALTESWRAGLIPIATDLGALGERISDGVDGFLVEPHDPGAVLCRLQTLQFDRALRATMRRTIAGKRFVRPEEHLARIADLYRRLIAAHPCPHGVIPAGVAVPFDLKLADLGLRVNSPHWFTRAIEWDAEIAPGPGEAMVEAAAGADGTLVALSPRPVLLKDRRTGCALDGFAVDGRPVAVRRGVEVAMRHFTVRGWFHHPELGTPERTFLRLVGSGGTFFAELDRHGRPDVAALYPAGTAEQAGFRGRIRVEDLPAGFYRADLFQISGGRSSVANGLLRLFVAGPVGDERGAWRRQPNEVVPAGAPGSFPIRHNLPEVDGVAHAAADGDWAVTFAPPPLPDDIEIVGAILRVGSGETTFGLSLAAPGPAPRRRPREVGFVGGLSNLPPDLYTLSLLAIGTRERLEIATGLRLHVGAGADLVRTGREPPRGFGPLWRRRFVGGAPAIEGVEAASSAEREAETVRCRGWAFRRGHGKPRCVVAQWSDGGRPRYCIGAPLERPEIAARLDHPNATGIGFSLLLPAASLRRREVRFFQVYDRRTVQFLGFARAALRRAMAQGLVSP